MSSPARERLSAPYLALLGILVLAPLPMGGAGTWALALVGIGVMIVMVMHLWLPDDGVAAREAGFIDAAPWRRARLPIGLMAVWTGLLGMQLLPLPAGWASWLDFNHEDGFPVLLGERAPLSVDPYATRLYLWKALVLLSFFWLVLRLATTRRRVELLLKTVAVCGFLQATVGILLFAEGATYQLLFGEVDHASAKGTFINRNHFAGYLGLALAMGIGLMIAKLEDAGERSGKQRIRDWLALLMSDKARLRIMLVVMVVGLIESRSRMGNAAFFFGLLITGAIAIALSKRATRATVIFLVSIVVLDVVVMGSVIGIDRVAQRIEETNLRKRPMPPPSAGAPGTAPARALPRQEGSLEERLEVARYSTAIIRDFPVFGTGGGTFYVSFRTYQPLQVIGTFRHAHNDYVEFAVESGLTGFALLAVMVAVSALRALRILVVRRDQFARGIAFGALMGIVTIVIHSVVDFNLQLPANAMMFLIILAMPYLVDNRSSRTRAA